VPRSSRHRFTAVGLFAGIGGIERGLDNSGFETQLLCEIDTGAQRVLKERFKDVHLENDVRAIGSLPKVDLVAAGFPCQDLSQAGQTAGIGGTQSSVVGEVFRLLGRKRTGPKWLLLENVPFMLQLERGKAMRYLVDELERLEFTWAYRVVDTRAFGLPQRRQRVILLASRTEDPRPALFGQDAGEELQAFSRDLLCGFFWTEGSRGLGWAVDAVPTLKGGSTIGIPSPPAIWDPLDGSITTPAIEDVERLQGFSAGWTKPAVEAGGVRRGHRWKLVGNAVSVPVAEWVGSRLSDPSGEVPNGELVKRGVAWPRAAWGHNEKVWAVDVSTWPVHRPSPHLRDFLQRPRTPLSYRAAAGFYERFKASTLKKERGFLEDVRRHVERTAAQAAFIHCQSRPAR
jgi:DNA (cytosine-5)-methyltransferase 1